MVKECIRLGVQIKTFNKNLNDSLINKTFFTGIEKIKRRCTIKSL